MTKNFDYMASLRNTQIFQRKNLSDKKQKCIKTEKISMSKNMG